MTEEKLTHAIRLLLAADKPTALAPLDILQTIRLLLQHADEKYIYPSQATLAEQLCSSEDAIFKSQERLKKAGWIVVRKGGYRGRTNLYTVVLDKLPVGDLSRTVVSQEAARAAFTYGNAVKVAAKKKFMKNWLQMWAFQVQKMIDRTGDSHKVCQMIDFALRSPLYRAKAHRGPSDLLKVWKVLLAGYDAHAATIAPAPVVGADSQIVPTPVVA